MNKLLNVSACLLKNNVGMVRKQDTAAASRFKRPGFQNDLTCSRMLMPTHVVMLKQSALESIDPQT